MSVSPFMTVCFYAKGFCSEWKKLKKEFRFVMLEFDNKSRTVKDYRLFLSFNFKKRNRNSVNLLIFKIPYKKKRNDSDSHPSKERKY